MAATRTNTGNDQTDIRRRTITTIRQDHLIAQLHTATPWELRDRLTNNRTTEVTKESKGNIATKVRKLTKISTSPKKWWTILMRVHPDREKVLKTRRNWIRAVLTNKDLSKLPMKNHSTKATSKRNPRMKITRIWVSCRAWFLWTWTQTIRARKRKIDFQMTRNQISNINVIRTLSQNITK